MTANEMPPMATPRVAAGALFFDDDEGRVLLVRPTYKETWDIPGGYVEPGEAPRAACIREVEEELGLVVQIGPMLVVDWAPAKNEGDKLLFIFDGHVLPPACTKEISYRDGEIAAHEFVSLKDLSDRMPERLARRIMAATEARRRRRPAYAEHGSIVE
ncbi:NUDIX domain-containing protein [Micromonospora sp. NPDC049048]|uniref:NUDIX domain-containing protein n=1 Tax=Micromonospora sp. NPDC049048 TaxID=3364263 RepID=UPI00371DF2AA